MTMPDSLYKRIVEDIEVTRQNMVIVGLKYGLTHSATIELSVQLDQLLNSLSLYERNKSR